MPELTSLDQVTAIDAATRKKLASYWIDSVEEFVSTAKASNQQYGSGRAALAIALGITDDQLKALLDAAMPLLPADVSFSVPVELDVGDGLFLDNFSDIDDSSFGPPVNLPEKVEPLGKLPQAAYQGVRNSCVAFTLAAMYQALSADATDLSEQFIYWACKDRDKIPGDVGTDPIVGMKVLQELGVCTESTWPYKPAPSDNTKPGHERPPEPAFVEAKRRRIKGYQQLPGKDFRQIKAALAAGKPVLIGLPIYEHWQGAWQSQNLGKLRPPLPGERRRGGHAMCVLGYRDDASAPGGGYFIVRNSWGPEWARDNPDGPGYAHIPYKVIFEHGLAAIAAEGVEVVAGAPPAGGAETTPGKRGRRRANLGGSAEGDGAEQGEITIDDLYDEVVELRAKLDQILALLSERAAPGEGAVVAAPVEATAPAEPPPLQPEEEAQRPGAPVAAPANFFSGPLVLVKNTSGPEGERLTPLGLGLDGKPLLEIDAAVAAELAQGALSSESKEQINIYKAKKSSTAAHLGVVADVSTQKLEESRWAVVINGLEEAALIKALWPLIEHRMREMGLTPPAVDWRPGESAAAWMSRHSDGGKQNLRDHWGKIPPVMIYRPGERVPQWLARFGVATGPVDPRRGVPYYLLLLGRPGPLNEQDETAIPLNFQYLLDIFWGVGRLCFTDAAGQHRLEDYTAYAQRVVAFEQAQDAASRLRKEVVYFSTKHDLDTSTIRSTNELTLPLVQWHTNPANTATKGGFAHRTFIEAEATKANLGGVLAGSGEGKPPAVLFTASHGLGLPLSDPRLPLHQGALITQDWGGAGPVTRDHWFAGEDLASDAKVDGMFAFLFACYGAGCPDKDEFIFDENKQRPQIATFPLIAQLPQRLLASGALGVLGHVERAWTYSFSGTEGVKGQSQPFEDVLARLLQGRRAGDATDQFNMIQGDRAMTLTEELENIKFGKIVDPLELSKLWMARNDARNYALLGDPAARLPY
jgi:hypothetical protein